MSGINPGDVVGGRYRIAEPLGAGGMARVYRATDMDLGRDVAVKVLADRYAADPAFVERFRREASAAAQLNHPNIVQVFDRGEAGGTYYIVMEYLPGPDLKEIIRRRGTISADETVEAGLQILSALSAAHRRDVIHRDIKPQNVIMSDEGMLKVTDFGIARAGADADMTEAGSVIGTAQYISPEQARGGEVTPASDCYSVGIVLYEMLTGRVPFDGEGAVAVAMKQVNEPPIPPRTFEPSIPPALEAVVLTALAKRPSERYRTAEAFSAALMEVRASLDQGAATSVMGAATAPQTRVMDSAAATQTRVIPPAAAAAGPPPARPAPPPPARRTWPLVLAVLALLAVIGVGAAIVLAGRGGDAKTVTVPADLVGQTEQDARTRLAALGLQVGTEQVESEAAQKGLVVGTTPAGGQSVDAGGTVVLQIGRGPATVEVKNVVGKDVSDAQVILRTQGFAVKVVQTPDDTAPKGRVLSQDPVAGTPAVTGAQVTLRVSSGPEKVSVPRLVGLQQSTAQTLLTDQGLTYSVSDRPSERSQGTVLEQDPAAGTKVDKGSTVSIVVAAGVEQVSVPGVVGRDVDTARSRLEGAGFTVTTVSQASDQPAGTVIDQSPAANTQVDAGSTITLTVSDGPATEPTPGPATSPSTTSAQPPPGSTTGAQAPAPGGTQ